MVSLRRGFLFLRSVRAHFLRRISQSLRSGRDERWRAPFPRRPDRVSTTDLDAGIRIPCLILIAGASFGLLIMR